MSPGFLLYRDFFKRVIDFCISLIAFVCLSPVFLLVSLMMVIVQRKAFFLQARPGKHGRIFKVIKFKTMNDRRGENGELLPDADRLTAIGSFVRKTSLDEIPQLLNVIKGDMSLVGPRPLLVEYLSLYNTVQKQRHEALPGMTGWAQVNGRNSISWDQKFEYDVWYVNNLSFALDVKIMWLTISKIFKSEGINSATSVTMEKFTGNI